MPDTGLKTPGVRVDEQTAELRIADPHRDQGAADGNPLLSRLTATIRSGLARTRTSLRGRFVGPRALHAGKYDHGAMGQVCKGTQILLMQRYQEARRTGAALPPFADVEFRNYSQNGEDGILLYIFALIGMGRRRCVEICAGDGIECNATNLILNHGFDALLVDGDEENVAAAAAFYGGHRDTYAFAPRAVRRWIDRETVDAFIRDQGMDGEIDLLTIDIDGNDYWIWEAIDSASPRVVVVEYDNSWGPDDAVAMRYDRDFVCRVTEPGMPTCGASLAAFASLGRRKGYRLVGCQMRCFNAFFVRDDVGRDVLPEVPVASCLTHGMAEWRRALRLSRAHSPLLKRFVAVW
jgi:hypothetical protein